MNLIELRKDIERLQADKQDGVVRFGLEKIKQTIKAVTPFMSFCEFLKDDIKAKKEWEKIKELLK